MNKPISEAVSCTPEGILPILKDSPIIGKSQALLEDALFFLTNLYFRTLYQYDNETDKNANGSKDYQVISAKMLKRLISGRNYLVVLKELERLKIIEIDKTYVPSITSRGYRLHSTFLKQQAKVRRFRLKSSIDKFLKFKTNTITKITKDYPYLEPMMNNITNTIFIDAEKAELFVQNLDLPEKKKQSRLNIIQAIKLGYTWNFKVAASNQRFFHIYTQLPKELRQFLYTINPETGEKDFRKIEIDGSNTQPLLNCILMRKSGSEPEAEYEKLCFDGTIYDEIAKNLNVPRDEIKLRYMDTFLYTANSCVYLLKPGVKLNDKNNKKREFVCYFNNTYKNTYQWQLLTKEHLKLSNTPCKNKRNKGGSLLAIENQSLESKLWIHSFLAKLPTDLIYFTIHDSIMIFQPSEEIVNLCKRILEETAKEVLEIDKVIPYKVKKVA